VVYLATKVIPPKTEKEEIAEEFIKRTDEFIEKMTLEEKVFQMIHNSAPVKRLGIRAYVWWNEALHGVARAGVATVFPQAIGMSAAFDDHLLYQVADIISTEGRAKYHENQRQSDFGMYKGLTFWSPNINIFRDPRWGRGHETYGEDPYLTSRLGAAFIRGIQGNDPHYLKAVACVKHFAAHSGPEGLRHEFNAEVSQKDLFETYLPAFEYCIKYANVESVMGAYNRLNGDACCGSKWLLTEVLRNRWGFKGHVVSDCGALCDFHEHHRVTENAIESSALALTSGTDLECGNFFIQLLQAHQNNLVTDDEIDTSVRRLLMARMKLGMFDEDKNVPFAAIPYEVVASKKHLDYSMEMAKASIVMLKNDGILPLNKIKTKTIAVIGPNADSIPALLGNYCGTPTHNHTILRGIQEAVGKETRVYYSQGCHLFKDAVDDLERKSDRISEAVSVAERSEVVVLCLGLDSSIEGEAGDANNFYGSGDKETLDLPPCQEELLRAVCATGKPVIVVILAGSALSINYAQDNVNAILDAWYPGEMGGKAVASVLFGDYNPSGKLPITFYKTTDELPAYEDYSMDNRTYRFMQQDALYPFGFGLSYSHFSYTNLQLSDNVIQTSENLICSVQVRNDGPAAGHEVVQMYLKDMEADVRVPRWSLYGFERVWLEQGEERTIQMELLGRQMARVMEDGNLRLESGKFTIYMGGSQPDDRSSELLGYHPLSAGFTVEGDSVQYPN
jgi:beta-glucosidase